MTKLKSKALRQGTKGFTLIEMAIVLVIIGLILASVMKGKDMIRSGQAKEFVEGFVYKWVNMAQSFKDKTGHVLTDSWLYAGRNETTDGLMDDIAATTSNSDNGTQVRNGEEIVAIMKNQGVDPCRMIKSDIYEEGNSTVTWCNGVNVFERTVKGENRIAHTKVLFRELVDVKLSDDTHLVHKNALVFPNVPIDVAKAIDKQLDGREDGTMGICIALTDAALATTSDTFDQTNSTGTTTTLSAKAWGTADQMRQGYVQTVAIVLEQ